MASITKKLLVTSSVNREAQRFRNQVLAKVTFLENLLVSSAVSHRKRKCPLATVRAKDADGNAFDEILRDAQFNFRKKHVFILSQKYNVIQN